MFAVMFEVTPRRERWDDYLALAAALRPELERIAGFIAIERFVSRRVPERMLSLSLWYNEKALVRWRTLPVHHEAQAKGRAEIFSDYRLRLGEVVGDSLLAADGAGQRFDETEVGAAKAVTITRAEPGVALPAPLVGAPGAIDNEQFESIANPGKLLWLSSWRQADDAAAWETQSRRELGHCGDGIRVLRVRVIRDYGLQDRREAPQYYPPITPAPRPINHI
jgi:heme-degrading monooxygenase HmoA